MDASNQSFTVKEILLEHVRDTANNFQNLERKIDVVALDHETRIRQLEKSGSRLSGAWSTISVAVAVLAGGAGLVLGALAYLGG